MTQEEIQQTIRKVVQRIVAQFHPEQIILFGSYARGEFTPDSDLDILVVMPVEGSTRQIANQIDLATADRTVPMDIRVMTPEQFERDKKLVGNVVREAAQEGKVVYERAT